MTLVLTTDELRVSATVHGGRIPEPLRTGWSTEDTPVADVVALRGLLARGLATADETEVSLADDLGAAVRPLLTADALVEVHRDGIVRPGRWLVTAHAGGVVSCAERRPDLWYIESGPGELIERLLTELVGHLPDREPSGATVTLSTELLVEAERRSATDAEHLPAMLAQRGMRPADADLVTGIVRDLAATVTVRSVHRNGSTISSAALTWLETATDGVWLTIPSEPATHVELRPVDRNGLLADLRDVLGELVGERIR